MTSVDDRIPDNCKQFIRTFDSLCAVTTAVEYLANRSVFRAPVSFNVSMVAVPSGAPPKSSDIELRAVINYWKKKGDISVSEAEQLYEKIPDKPSVGGSCHCEADVMATLCAQGFANAPREMREVINPTMFSVSMIDLCHLNIF